jgi:hypothetical protein
MAKPRSPMDRAWRYKGIDTIISRLAGMLAEQFSYVVCAAYGYGYASAQLV